MLVWETGDSLAWKDAFCCKTASRQQGDALSTPARFCCSQAIISAAAEAVSNALSACLCAVGTVDNPGSIGTYTSKGGGGYDLFVRKVDAQGVHVYTQIWGSSTTDAYRCGGVA